MKWRLTMPNWDFHNKSCAKLGDLAYWSNVSLWPASIAIASIVFYSPRPDLTSNTTRGIKNQGVSSSLDIFQSQETAKRGSKLISQETVSPASWQDLTGFDCLVLFLAFSFDIVHFIYILKQMLTSCKKKSDFRLN